MTAVYSMLNGLHMIFIPNPRDLSSVVSAIRETRPAIFCGLNTLFVALSNDEGFKALDFSGLKVTLSGGMALSHAAAAQWQEVTGCEIAEGYGLTETSPVVSSNPGNRKIIGTIGPPVPNTEVKVVDDDGNVQPIGERGELCVKGPQVMLGYRNRPEETAESLRDGWLYTGDIGYLDEDNYLFVTGRKKEMLLVSGFNVFPREIEELLFLYSGIKEAAVVGKEDEYRGELPIAFIVAVEGENLDVDQLRTYCETKLADYKVPVEFRIVSSLPKTAVGKVNKITLTSMANNNAETE
jgi:long-chain acyl-CoA synthetase